MKKNAKSPKVLKLNRETIARLGNEELAKAAAALQLNDGYQCTGCDSGCGIFD